MKRYSAPSPTIMVEFVQPDGVRAIAPMSSVIRMICRLTGVGLNTAWGRLEAYPLDAKKLYRAKRKKADTA